MNNKTGEKKLNEKSKEINKNDYFKSIVTDFIIDARRIMKDETDNEFKRVFLKILLDLENAEDLKTVLMENISWFKENSFHIVSLRINRTAEIYCIIR